MHRPDHRPGAGAVSEPQHEAGRGFLSAPGWFAAQVRGTSPEPPPEGFLVPPGLAEGLMETLREHLAAAGAWYESHAAPIVPVPWHVRLRWAAWNWRHAVAKGIYRTIMGFWPCDCECPSCQAEDYER